MFKNAAAEFVYTRTYARWNQELGRRETWPESVKRLIDYYKEVTKGKITDDVFEIIESQILSFDTMPSMRLMWAAGPVARQENATAYNCSFMPIKDIRAFAEMLYILMCGTGAGFSCEERFISQLPVIKAQTSIGRGIHEVGDSREGWTRAFLAGLEAWFNGDDIEFDYSKVRPRGARLMTMGGRASGPEPLKRLLDFVRSTVFAAQGRQLTDLEVHDIACEIAEIVVVGGVRRSSLISFSDIDSEPMRKSKIWPMPPRRYMANNSAVFESKPDIVTFLKEWTALVASGTGERGIYNISNIGKFAPRRDFEGKEIRSNPCGEILLREFEFCNLSEVVVRATDDYASLEKKVEVAVWMGAIQSTLTDFKFIRDEFRENCEEERLLGVSLTGQMDNPKLMTSGVLEALKNHAVAVAAVAADCLDVPMSVSITTGKPSGTVSQLVDAASGCHPRHNDYYIRRYRISGTDPLFKMMKAQGFKFTPENGQNQKDWDKAAYARELIKNGVEDDKVKRDASACTIYADGDSWSEEKVQTWVVSFPMKAPEGCITRHDVSAIDQLEWYRKVQANWCEHNQSTTVYVSDDEWLEVGDYVYKHFDEIVGVSFLPKDGGKYEQAPYEDITKDQYLEMSKDFPKIDYSQLSSFEMDDNTSGAKSFACTGDKCELV